MLNNLGRIAMWGTRKRRGGGVRVGEKGEGGWMYAVASNIG